jgi:hypothetical protein
MQKKRESNAWKLLLGIMAAVMIVFMATGCPTDGGDDDDEGPTNTITIGDKVIPGTGQKVKTAVYIEVNDHNPLNAGAYTLEDGTPLFDYVILFAANIRTRNCATETDMKHGCTKSGPHVHLNENVRYILENRQEYIVPLQNKGIKVLLGLLGDHDGITFASMNDTDRATFIADLKNEVEHYHLDGVDFDDEWGSKEDWGGWGENYTVPSPNAIFTYPTSSWGWPFTGTVYRNPDMGIVAGNAQLTAPSADDQDRMWKETGPGYYKTILAAREALGDDKIISLYEYNTGRYITPGGKANGDATLASFQDAISFAMQPWYSQYIDDSANGLPRSKYSPFGIDLGGNAYYQGGTPLPPIVEDDDENGTGTIKDYATRFKSAATGGNAYNVLYFFNLKPHTDGKLKHDEDETEPSVTTEEYISKMTRIVFEQDCLRTPGDGDHRKNWSFD